MAIVALKFIDIQILAKKKQSNLTLLKREKQQGIDYLALAAESKTVSKKLNIRRSVERLKTKLPRSITRLPIYDREQILAEIDSELPDGVIDQSTDKLQYLNQLIDDTDPILLMPPESEVWENNLEALIQV